MGFVDESGRFISIADCPFGRRGSYFAVCSNGTENFGRAYVHLATCHGMATASGKTKLFNLHPTYQGERVPFAVIMKPAELILRTLYGDVRICIAEKKLMLFKGENGLGIRFSSTPEQLDRVTKPRGKNAWETLFSNVMTTVIHPIIGTVTAYAPWHWDELRSGKSKIDLLPDENGDMLGSLEEFSHSGYVRENYPSYEESLAAVTADWEAFLSNIPKLPGRYEALRAKAAWNLWSFLMSPAGLIKREYLYMSKMGSTSQWQLTYQAIAFANNTKAAWDQMLVPFDYQSETGQLPDYYDECRGAFAAIRPPIHGWALKQMKRLGYYQNIPLNEIADFYPKLAAWADWFARYRTDGVDGLPQYEFSEESGMEDGSTFRESCVMVTPDLPAYLVLLFEELGEMSHQLGMDPTVSEGWYKKAADIQARLIEKLWDGERFVSHTLEGRRIEKDYGILGYMPIVLGKRLPEEILSKLISDLKIEGYVLSDYGFDKEKVSARDLCDIANNWVRGFIYHPFNVMLISALHDCGEVEFARMVANRYCGAMADVNNLAGSLNSFTGAIPGQWLSWTAGAYLLIAGFTQ
jgi:putative isomerase